MREAPQNIKAEIGLIGALLANNKALGRVEEFLRAEHFYDPLHGRIYDAIMQRVAAGGVADGVSLRPLFEHDQMAIDAGGWGSYSGALLRALVGPAMAGPYGQEIRSCWMRRNLIEACAATVEAAFGGNGHSAECGAIMEELDARLLKIAEGAGDETPLVHFADAVRQQLVATEAAAKRESALAGITTGYPALDRMTMGLCEADYILLAARPSMGKTALGLGIAVRAAQAGHRVLFWSGEMTGQKLAARAAAAYSGLSTTSVFTARNWQVPPDAHGRPMPLSAGDWARLTEAERMARTLPLFIDTRPGVSVQGLRARARRMKRQKEGLGLIVLDYVGLMRASEGQPKNLYEKLTGISAELVALKKELGVPVLVLAQLNRANEGRDDKMPAMSDLRDSGALEQDADVIMLLHRPHYYLSRSEPARRGNEADDKFYDRVAVHEEQVRSEHGRAQVNIVKNRNGATGVTRLRFHDETTWFRDESEDPAGPAWGGRMDV